ncbi:uncharacterized protein BDR25DRAFT_306467 [Lindgomyces ingoldianus]|uniref:Uncharacterized protein n=1 Tax=Lindgomyces ingoldianus TaxID=673940 RepID=A0ACB6QGA6_9PLEO|nr:uncharacterized protein BDR25DRAFT_306467 [Lindgomyces ingoldianus]KAF2466024.1 hypothetical protein BDR25DRAFT_306467 [Lindgomyces ingoldianus]
MSTPLATVGILSIGSMGLGITKLLVANNYLVLTNVSNRSPATQTRAQSAQLGLVNTDAELVTRCDYILSIVPPRDAIATARRIIDALNSTPPARLSTASPLYYLDLNAISPSTASTIDKAFKKNTSNVRFIDGGIIGGPPTQSPEGTWKNPGIPLSGPYTLKSANPSGAHLAETLNTSYIDANIGSASGLKCCFASLSKGMIAISLQAFSTASSLNVLPHLQSYLEIYNPRAAETVGRGIVNCPPKAYRWIEEMRHIGECFEVEGGWPGQARVFREIAGVYEALARVVEARNGTEGMGDVDGTIGALQDELKGRQRKRRMSVELEQDDQ